MKKNVFGALLALSLSAAIPGAALAGEAAAEAASEVSAADHVENLVIGTTTADDTFNLLSQGGSFGRTNYNCLANADFVYRDANAQMKPYFLTSYEFSDDDKVLTLKFPTDKVWHDGEPVTAEDVKFTFEYKRDVMKTQTLQNLTDIEITADDTVKLTFSEPDGYAFLAQGCGNNNCVIPKHIWEKIGADEYSDYAGDDACIGCGPYKLVSYDMDAGVSQYEAVPQDAYLGDLTVDSITIRSYSSQDALLMAMASGEIDCMFDYASPIDVSLLSLVEDSTDIDLGSSDYAGNYQLYFGMERAPGNDYAFREAVTKALNWTLVCQLINGEYGQIPGSGIITPSCLGFDDSLYHFEQDVEAAKQILDEAGYADVDGDGIREGLDGKELKVKVTPQFTTKKQELLNRIADVLMSSLKDVGIETYMDEESLQSSEIWEANMIDGDYDLFIGYTTSGMAKYTSAFRYYVAVDRNGNDDSSVWIWGTDHDKAFNDLVWDMIYCTSEENYISDIRQLQKMASEQLFGCALCWEKCFFPYRTDKYEGFDNWPSWGVVNAETFYRLTNRQ